jgi:UDP-N-acetylglucosamine 2-epimerase (non-hydrolysing)
MVKEVVEEKLGHLQNVMLLDPLDYEPFVHLMKAAYLILTDSGGIQEEAPSLGVPVLVMREVTERPEGVDAGAVKLVGLETKAIVEATEELLTGKRVEKDLIDPEDGSFVIVDRFLRLWIREMQSDVHQVE